MKLLLEILSPTKTILKDEIDEITIPTTEGEITVLPNHVNLITKVSTGEISIRKSGKIDHLVIIGGFLEVSENHVNVLSNYAVLAQDIEISRVEEAKQRAEKAMKDKDSEKAYEQLQDDIRRATLELKVARKHKGVKVS